MAQSFPSGRGFVRKMTNATLALVLGLGMGSVCNTKRGRGEGYTLRGEAAGERPDQAGRGPGKRRICWILFPSISI